MTSKQLTIVVTCTDRKSRPPSTSLSLRDLPPGAVPQRALTWKQRLAKPEPRLPLVDLYQGEAWTQAKRLIETVRSTGRNPVVLVASAGLGLRHLSQSVPSYAATFSAGHPDSVATNSQDARAWWKALPHDSAPIGGSAVWVLSQAYSNAIATDLLERTRPDQLLVFGGCTAVPEHYRVKSDRALRSTLGGTATSLNLRAANQWMTLSTEIDPYSTEARDRWDNWTEENRSADSYDRKSLNDESVIVFIRQILKQQSNVSKTRALRALRDAGFACEQARFANLFNETAGE